MYPIVSPTVLSVAHYLSIGGRYVASIGVSGTVRYGTVRQGYLRTLQTFVDILHSFCFVFILFYFITPKPNKRIKQNKSFSTFCIAPPFCRLHCVWHPNGIVSRPQSLFTERDSVWYLSLYECLSMGGLTSPSLPPSLLSPFC